MLTASIERGMKQTSALVELVWIEQNPSVAVDDGHEQVTQRNATILKTTDCFICHKQQLTQSLSSSFLSLVPVFSYLSIDRSIHLGVFNWLSDQSNPIHPSNLLTNYKLVLQNTDE